MVDVDELFRRAIEDEHVAFIPGHAFSVNDEPLRPCTASENVAVTLLPSGTAVASTVGFRAVTVGGVEPAQVAGLLALLPVGS